MKTHRFDPISFLAGLAIAGIGLTFLLLPELGSIIDFFTDAGAWFWPIVFLAIGFAILVPVVTRREGLDDEAETEATDD
jgi:F0F1-type ATP synthase assembly protein I